MPVLDYALMLICLVVLAGLIVSAWERYFDPPLIRKYDGQGAWAKNSSKIPRSAWLLSSIVIALFLFGPTLVLRALT